jgi:hypothetical protein
MLRRLLFPAVILAGLLSMFVYRISNNVVDVDLWHEMALAREALACGHVPLEDHFAYTPTKYPVVHHEWGAGVAAFCAMTSLGDAGIVVAKYLLALGLGAVCWLCAWRRGASFGVLSFLAAVAVLLADQGFSTIRAQMYSFLFTACLLCWMDRDREGDRRWLLAWLPLYVVWLNVHGGFLVGAGLFGVYWLEQLMRRQPHDHLLLAGLLMIALIAVNPYGLHYYGYLINAATMPRPLIDEWGPLWRNGDFYQIALFGLSLVLLGYTVRHVGFRAIRGLPVILVCALFAFKSTRLLNFYAVAWLCYLPSYLEATPLGQSLRQRYQQRAWPLMAVWAVMLAVCIPPMLTTKPWLLRIPEDRISKFGNHVIYPVSAVDYLAGTGFRGNLMVPFDWGAYVSWRLYPDVKVSIDSRYEVAYPPGSLENNSIFYRALDNWQAILAAEQADAVLVPNALPVSQQMPSQPGWRRVYGDDNAQVYRRTRDVAGGRSRMSVNE